MTDMISQILGILGWLVIGVILFILVILLIVLFHPVGYRLVVSCNESSFEVSWKASWVFGLVRAIFEYPFPSDLIIKFGGIRIFSLKQTKSGNLQNKKKDKKESSDHSLRTEEVSKESSSVKKTEEEDTKGTYMTESEPEEGDKQTDETFFSKICKKFEKMKNQITKVTEKAKEFIEKLEYEIHILKEDETGKVISRSLQRISHVIRKLRPRSVKGELCYGTGQPDTTGYVMAVYGLLYPYFGKDFIFQPDFEQKIIKGHVTVKGYITLFHFVKIAIAFLFDKSFRTVLGRMKNFDAG